MKSRSRLVILMIVLLLIPSWAFASTVYEGTGWIVGTEGVVVEFSTDTAPYTYVATLADLSFDPYFGFDFLFLSISSASETIDELVVNPLVGKGSLMFPVTPGETLFANIFGKGSGEMGAGNYGLRIDAIPVPASVLLLGSGLFALVTLKRKKLQ